MNPGGVNPGAVNLGVRIGHALGQRVRFAVGLLLLAAISFTAIESAPADPKDPTMDRPLADPAQEAAARAFMHEIRCVVCQSQSIDESDAEIAAQLRNVVREQFAAGKSEAEIRDYLVARYGDFVLFKPPFKASTLILWLGPFALAGLGLAGAVGVMRRNRAARAAAGGAGNLAPPELNAAERRRLEQLLVDARPDSPAAMAGTGTAPAGTSEIQVGGQP
jgi:cytochrome c-type biogenesis protein CcmH